MTSEEHTELVQLRKEVQVLREERDILKRATLSSRGQCNSFSKTAFFAKEGDSMTCTRYGGGEG
jgi:transposase-like protein